MDILGFRLINDGASAAAWQQEVEHAASRGMLLTTLEVLGGRTDEGTGDFVYDSVEVRDAETAELLERFAADEFRNVKYDEKGWFDANGPYEPQG